MMTPKKGYLRKTSTMPARNETAVVVARHRRGQFLCVQSRAEFSDEGEAKEIRTPSQFVSSGKEVERLSRSNDQRQPRHEQDLRRV